MNSTVLLQKLLTIERAIGTLKNGELRDLVQDAEDCLLQMQKERAEGFLAHAWREALVRPNLLRKAS